MMRAASLPLGASFIAGRMQRCGLALCFEYDDGHIPHRVRCYRFAYIGWQVGGNLLLKYHNLHADLGEYHHRVYDPATGKEIMYERLQRYQFPTFPEVLDELEYLAQRL